MEPFLVVESCPVPWIAERASAPVQLSVWVVVFAFGDFLVLAFDGFPEPVRLAWLAPFVSAERAERAALAG